MVLAFLSGLAGVLTEIREFVLAVRFARPEALALLLLLPVFAVTERYAAVRQSRTLARIGRSTAVASLRTQPEPRHWWLRLAYPLAWVLLVVAFAGPKWGKSEETGIAVGRDLIVVVDLSRSMMAEDMAAKDTPTRWQAARAGLLDLIDAISRRGGHRVGVVVFAARPILACPLTTDYDHVRAILADLDGHYPPPECRPGTDDTIRSGTRIGAALRAAVEAHDSRFPGSQDIILLTDGDDPVDDHEWARGADAAQITGIPVHTVGLGDPDADSFIPLEGGLLELPPQGDKPPDIVRTRLREKAPREIAADTRGKYLASRRDVPQLGEFFRRQIEPYPSRSMSDDSVPLRKERYVWFLVPAVAFLAIGWFRGC